MDEYKQIFDVNRPINVVREAFFSAMKKIPKEDKEARDALMAAHDKFFPDVVRANLKKNVGWCTE